MKKNEDKIEGITKDLEHFKASVQLNEDGSYRNPIKLTSIETADLKAIGKQLNHIAETARTHGALEPVGTLYGFDLLVQSETTEKDGFELVQNRFYARREADYLYSYNHGKIASDPRLAAMNFINALGTIETVLENFKTKNEELARDIPILKEVVEGTWRKESELSALKTQKTEIDRKIQLSLKPIEQGEEVMEQEEASSVERKNEVASENVRPFVPNRLQQIADTSNGRIVIGRIGTQAKAETAPCKKLKM